MRYDVRLGRTGAYGSEHTGDYGFCDREERTQAMTITERISALFQLSQVARSGGGAEPAV